MSNHRSDTPRRRRRSGRTRALMSLGAVVVLSTGMSVKGTFAFWTDAATASSGTFTAGTLDITIDGALAGQANNGKTTAIANLNLDKMVPGESVAAAFQIKNEGNIALTFNGTGTGAGALAVANGLQYSITFGVAADNAVVGGLRTGTCGGVLTTDANTPMKAATPYTFATNRALAVNAQETVCIVARLHKDAPNGLQGATGSATFLFDSKQVGA